MLSNLYEGTWGMEVPQQIMVPSVPNAQRSCSPRPTSWNVPGGGGTLHPQQASSPEARTPQLQVKLSAATRNKSPEGISLPAPDDFPHPPTQPPPPTPPAPPSPTPT